MRGIFALHHRCLRLQQVQIPLIKVFEPAKRGEIDGASCISCDCNNRSHRLAHRNDHQPALLRPVRRSIIGLNGPRAILTDWQNSGSQAE